MSTGDSSTPMRLAWLKRRVDKFRDDRKLTEKAVYEAIGMTKTGYRQMWERDTVKYTALQGIAKLFKISMSELQGFEDAGAPPVSVAAEPAGEYRTKGNLENRVRDLEQKLERIGRVLV